MDVQVRVLSPVPVSFFAGFVSGIVAWAVSMRTSGSGYGIETAGLLPWVGRPCGGPET